MKVVAALLAIALILPAADQFSNRRAPGFSLPDADFVQHDPQDYRGKVLLVDIMLTSCPVCKQLAENLVLVQKKYGDKIGIISVVTLPDTFSEAQAFAGVHHVTWPVVFDSGQMIASYLKVTPLNPQVHFPHLFVIDGNGMIRNDYEGTDEGSLSVEGLSATIDHLLTGAK